MKLSTLQTTLLALFSPPPAMSPSASSNTTIYFGYGSNLWKHQMRQRCPTSSYLGLARLDSYKWIINDRGYANVVEVNTNTNSSEKNDEVWGLVYSLEAEDERRLDLNEGVPISYTKENIATNFWPLTNSTGRPNVTDEPERVSMLVYIDRNRTEPDVPKKEYIYRMNMGIKDALGEGMPEGYVEHVLREFIPEGKTEEEEGVKGLAEKQAVFFEDEGE